ncbi:LysR family transcriptional regulator [Devosia sp.]|uniref:LysR family transcriptional regulator n=1 Tax=Devosia sp. TaxID=1871048 RepID=UPI002EEC9286
MATTTKAAGGSHLTLHQLRVVWAIAHAETVSRAAKQLGLSQPSLSQQVAKLEASIGQKVFDRGAGRMTPTEIGSFIVERAEQVMREVQELEDGLGSFAGGTRTIGIAGISSPVRTLLPLALRRFRESHPQVMFDVQESSPGDVLAMLYARRANIGIVAASSIAQAGMSFVQMPLLDDPYVLVVPEGLDLDGVGSEDELDAAQRATLNSVIHFIYGTQHQKRIEEWYETALGRHRVVARCRSFEGAVAMVRAGLGVCLAPALSCHAGDAVLAGIRLYDVALGDRRPLVALVPSQYRHLAPYPELIETLQEVARLHVRPHVGPLPPLFAARDPGA